MIVQVTENKGVSQDTSFLCNQYDNESANIEINLSALFVNQTYLYFLICKSPDKTVNQYSVPLLLREGGDLNFVVNSTLSSKKGYWEFCLVIKEASGNLVAVTNYWTGVVKSGIVAEDELAEQVEDSNLVLANQTMLEEEILRVIAEGLRNNSEASRDDAEGIRNAAEEIRAEAENLREAAYTQAELNRGSLYATAEGVRNNQYLQAENNRNNDYDDEEQTRNNDYGTAEITRDGLYATAEGVRNNQYLQAENNRNNDYDDEEQTRNNDYGTAEITRDGLYSTAEGNRDSQYAQAENGRDSDYNVAEGLRDGLYATAEQKRDNDYETAELTRDDLYTAAEGNRDNQYSQAEDGRDSLYIQAETGRDTAYGARVTAVETDLAEHKLDYANLVDEVTELAYITQKYTIDSWQKVQDIVRVGLADKAFKEGYQFQTTYNSNPFIKDIIGINHDIPTDKKYKNSLTLQFHDCLDNVQFSAPQAFYHAETELPAGTHIFTLNNLKYSFTTTKAIPIGGVAYARTWSDPYIPGKITTYAADRITVIEADIAVTTSEGAPTLLTINEHARCRYGSNDYAKSAIRQWLNSEETIFKWKAQGLYDMPSTGGVYAGAGYLKRLDPELVTVLGAVDKQVAKATIDGGGQDIFSDKVFLLSTKEVYGANEGTITGENPYPWYSALASNPTNDPLVGRIKYLTGSARFWWLRSPYVGYSGNPRYVYTTGHVSSYYGAYSAYGLAPACCIV